jgi:hypothetical protein
MLKSSLMGRHYASTRALPIGGKEGPLTIGPTEESDLGFRLTRTVRNHLHEHGISFVMSPLGSRSSGRDHGGSQSAAKRMSGEPGSFFSSMPALRPPNYDVVFGEGVCHLRSLFYSKLCEGAITEGETRGMRGICPLTCNFRFEAKAPVNGLADYGEILIHFDREAQSVITAKLRCLRT